MNTHFNKKRIHKFSSKVNKCSSSAQSPLITYLLSPGKEPLEFSSNRVGKVLSPGVRFDTLHPLKNLSVALESCICSEGPRLIEARAEVVSCAKFSLLAGEGSAGEKERGSEVKGRSVSMRVPKVSKAFL